MSRPRSAERSEGSLGHAQALPENVRSGAPDATSFLALRTVILRQWIACVNASLACARRFAALTHAIHRPELALIEAPAACQQVWQTVVSYVQNRRAFLGVPRRESAPFSSAMPPKIHAANTTRGTQDVNDPSRATSHVPGPYTGSFTSWVPLLR